MSIVIIGRCTVDNDGSVTVHPLTDVEQRQAMAALYPAQALQGSASPRTGPGQATQAGSRVIHTQGQARGP